MTEYGNIIKVLYQPAINNLLIHFIKEMVSPTMTDMDGDSSQYSVDYLKVKIEDEKYTLNHEEIIFMKFCEDNNIEYLEL